MQVLASIKENGICLRKQSLSSAVTDITHNEAV